MSDPSSYSSLWQHIVLAETRNAQEINLFAQYDLSPANSLHEYIGFVKDYISKFSTQSLRNISLLINDFSLKTIEIKSIKKSENHRLKGNAFYQKKLHDSAIVEYRTALQQAPSDSQEISLIYANISAVYLQEKKYQSCLNAIQYALENNYPSSKRNKLSQRIETLLKESGCTTKFHESPTFSELKSFVKTIFLNNDDVNVVYPDCDIKYGPHKELLNFSSACRLNYSCEKGRYIVIDEDFVHGDIVLVEDPYAWLLLKPYRSRYCYGCLVELESPIPCTGCVEALYCSPDCMKKSWTSFHQYECKFMFLLNCIGVAHLCFKILLLAGIDQVKYAVNTSVEVCQAPIIPEKGYHSVWSLVDNWTKYSNESLFEYGLTAWLVVQILIAGGFVSIDDKEEKDSLMVAALHHLLQLQCNAHAITTITEEHDEENNSNVHSVCQVRIATAIYPSASLLNHSCEPSVINSFHGTQLILRIQKTMKSQDELFNCYGPHYLRHDWQQRRSNLWEQYFFECRCSHCISMDSASAWLTAYVCSKCASQLEKSDTLRCSNCGQEQTLSDLERIVQRGDQLWNDAFRSGSADLARLTECYNIRRSLLHPHNRILTRTADTLAQHLWRAAADSHSPDFMHRSLSLSESILKSVAVVFGEKSVEWAWEAIKLAEMIRIAPDSCEDRAKDLCGQSFHVFKLNFGEFIAKSIFIKRKMNDFL